MSETVIQNILEYNKAFVANKEYEPYVTGNLPKKKLAIVTCKDTRLTTLLPAALGIKNGDAKIIKTAGATIDEPYGSVMRSLLIAIYALQVETILVIGHRDCGARMTDGAELVTRMLDRGISNEEVATANQQVDTSQWLEGFHHLGDNIRKSVAMVENHPLIPADIIVKGLIIDPITGELTEDLTIEN